MVKEYQKREELKELVKKAVGLTLGLAGVAERKVREVAAELIKKGEIKKEEAERFIDRLLEKTEKDRSELEERLSVFIHKVIERIPLATKSELEELEERIAAIEKKLE